MVQILRAKPCAECGESRALAEDEKAEKHESGKMTMAFHGGFLGSAGRSWQFF